MADEQNIHIDDPEHVLRRLQPEHIESLQRFLERCADYAMIVEGEGVSPTAAQELLQSVPSGRSLNDKFLVGLFGQKGDIVGVLEGMRGFLENPLPPPRRRRARPASRPSGEAEEPERVPLPVPAQLPAWEPADEAEDLIQLELD